MSDAEQELEKLSACLREMFPDAWSIYVVAEGRSPVDLAIGRLRDLKERTVKIERGEQLFDLLDGCDWLDEFTRKLRMELSDQAIAYHLRTTAEASLDDDEARLLRDAADVLETPL